MVDLFILLIYTIFCKQVNQLKRQQKNTIDKQMLTAKKAYKSMFLCLI